MQTTGKSTSSIMARRAQAGAPRVEFVGRGFNPRVLALMQAQPEVAAVEARNGKLTVDLHQKGDTAPLVSLLVGAGVQVEEVRRGQASLEEVFLTLTEEEA